MGKAVFLMLSLALHVGATFQTVPPPPPMPPAPKAGAPVREDSKKLSLVLLDKLQDIFGKTAALQAMPGKEIPRSLESLMREARNAREASRIEEHFFRRYSRLIRVLKMATMEDPEQILQPVLLKEIGEFVRDILGGDPKSDAEVSIGRFADAVATELTRLRGELVRSR